MIYRNVYTILFFVCVGISQQHFAMFQNDKCIITKSDAKLIKDVIKHNKLITEVSFDKVKQEWLRRTESTDSEDESNYEDKKSVEKESNQIILKKILLLLPEKALNHFAEIKEDTNDLNDVINIVNRILSLAIHKIDRDRIDTYKLAQKIDEHKSGKPEHVTFISLLREENKMLSCSRKNNIIKDSIIKTICFDNFDEDQKKNFNKSISDSLNIPFFILSLFSPKYKQYFELQLMEKECNNDLKIIRGLFTHVLMHNYNFNKEDTITGIIKLLKEESLDSCFIL